MKRTILLALTIFTTMPPVYSQVQVGLMHDLDGTAFNGYVDPFTYFPINKLQKIHFYEIYEKGRYYDSIGNLTEGVLAFDNARVLFKENENSKSPVVLRPGKVMQFVIGVDSFVAISNYYEGKKLKAKPEFMQYIAELKGRDYMKFYDFAAYAEDTPAAEVFFVKERGESTWENLSDKNQFKEQALKHFGNIAYLNEKINNGSYDRDDLMAIIKMAEYQNKYEKKEPIFYDGYWAETGNKNNAIFFARITGKKDSTWTLEYYRDSTKLYQVHYSSFYPNTKNGDLVCFYPGGAIRQITSYINNKPREVKTFSEMGKLSTHYEYIQTKNNLSKNEILRTRYISVMDAQGNEVLNKTKSATLQTTDQTNGFSYTAVFDKDKLSACYRLMGADTVFQITNDDYDFKSASLQNEFHYYATKRMNNEAISENAQGVVLARLLINEEGFVIKDSVLNTVHQQFANTVKDFIRIKFSSEAKKRYRFHAYKRNGSKKSFEIIMPFEFVINRFYHPSVDFYHFYNPEFNQQNTLMNQQMMMQQQMMMMQQMQTMPTMPMGF